MRSRTPNGSESRSTPATRTLPASFFKRVQIMFIVVLLPAPLSPRNAKRLPLFTKKEMSSTAFMSPKLFLSPVISIAFMKSSRGLSVRFIFAFGKRHCQAVVSNTPAFNKRQQPAQPNPQNHAARNIPRFEKRHSGKRIRAVAKPRNFLHGRGKARKRCPNRQILKAVLRNGGIVANTDDICVTTRKSPQAIVYILARDLTKLV